MPCHRKREANRKTRACGKNHPPAEEVGRLPRVGAQSPYRIMGHYGKSGETGEEKLARCPAADRNRPENKSDPAKACVAHLSPGQETSQGSWSSYCFVT